MIRLLKFTAIGALLPILASPQGHGQEWPRFRGPNGQGQGAAPAIPAQWTDDDYCWVADLPGIGNSSPVLWGNRIFLQSADPNTGAQYVVCIDATIGKIIWQREFASSTYPIHGRNSFASASPAADERRVYVAWATPEQLTLGALDHHGKVEWMRKDLGPYASQHGFGVSPMLVGDLVILCNQQSPPETGSDQTSSIMAFDQRTGDLRWETPRRSDKVSYSVPCLHTRPDGTIELIGCSTADGFYSLDPETGRENWTAEAFTMRTVSSPVLLENLLLGTTGSGGGGNYVVAVRLDDPQHEQAYRINRQAPYVPTSVAAGKYVFLWSDKGVATCLDAASGEEQWVKRVGGNYSGSPVHAAGRIYCISDDGDVVVLAAAPQYELLGRNPLGEGSRSTPAVAQGRMFLRTYSRLFCIGGDDREIR